jgi:hypothetical protein
VQKGKSAKNMFVAVLFEQGKDCFEIIKDTLSPSGMYLCASKRPLLV